jgi:ATP-binding cassette subfamily B protein
MGPGLRPGDELELEAVPFGALRAGDVVVFEGRGPGGRVQSIAHRIVSIGPQGPITRGDANPTDDDAPLTPEAFAGRVVAVTRKGVRQPVPGGGAGRRLGRWYRLRNGASRLPLLWRAVLLVFRPAPHGAAVWLALLTAQGLVPVGQVFATRSLVDGLAGAAGHGAAAGSLRAAVVAAVVLGALMALQHALSAASGWVHAVMSERVRDALAQRIQETAAALPFSAFEDPALHDRLHRARSGGADLPLSQVSNLGSLFQGTLSLVAMGAVLLRYGAAPALLLLAGTLPTLWVAASNSRRQWAWQRKRTPETRRVGYYDWLLTGREAAAELRVLGLAPHWRQAFDATRATLRGERLAFVKRQAIGQFAANVLGLATAGGAFLVMARRAVAGLATLGDLALFAQAFNQGQGLIRGLLQTTAQTYTNLLSLSDLFEFLDAEIADARPGPAQPLPAEATREPVAIRFEGVRFTYPGAERPALKGLDLELPAGQVTALVGDNGAGKSTLVKLLCRLYEPSEGRITWNGLDARTLDATSLRERVAILMQVPMSYQASARLNVQAGKLDASEAQIEAAAAAAGFDTVLKRLPRGWDTHLGKWLEDGADLSTGEWQRLALARALVRPFSLLILDEPTSALDAWAEADFWRRLEEARQGRTALVVTHRLTTARRADRVCVLSGGAIVEAGTHADLLKSKGRYAAAWYLQGSRLD